MSYTTRTPQKTIGVNRSVWTVRFRPDTAANPTYIQGKAAFSVVHTATGQWTVTFRDAAYKVVGHSCGVSLATPAAAHMSVTFANEGTNTALTALVSHFTTALADIASDANNWISLTVEVENSRAG